MQTRHANPRGPALGKALEHKTMLTFYITGQSRRSHLRLVQPIIPTEISLIGRDVIVISGSDPNTGREVHIYYLHQSGIALNAATAESRTKHRPSIG